MRRVFLGALLCAGWAMAQPVLPDETGKAEVERLCKGCHEVARSVAPRQDRAGWNNTLIKMTAFGMKTTAEEYTTLLDYLSRAYPAEAIPKVNVNKATAIELESGLTLRRSQAAAVLAYRQKNGEFKSLDDLKKVPGLDATYLEEKKERIAF